MAMYNARARRSNTDAEREALYNSLFGDLRVPKTTIARVADQFDHIRGVAGVEVLGIGGDYKGNDQWAEGLEDVSTHANLFAELIHRGGADRELEMITGARR